MKTESSSNSMLRSVAAPPTVAYSPVALVWNVTASPFLPSHSTEYLIIILQQMRLYGLHLPLKKWDRQASRRHWSQFGPACFLNSAKVQSFSTLPDSLKITKYKSVHGLFMPIDWPSCILIGKSKRSNASFRRRKFLSTTSPNIERLADFVLNTKI